MRQDGYRPRRPFKSRTSVNREAARDRPIVAADHCDAAKAYDPIVMTESGGLDITKRHRGRQVIQPHVPSSASWAAAQQPPPPPKPRGGLAALAGRESQSGSGLRQYMHPSIQ